MEVEDCIERINSDGKNNVKKFKQKSWLIPVLKI